MHNFKEKLSILSEMISFAKVDDIIKPEEYGFLQSVAQQLGVDKETFESLFSVNVEHIVPKSQADRILQFHRLVLLMNVDQKQDEVEINRIHNVGLAMGLPPSAIEQVLYIMHQYPNKVVPPKVLIEIFKAHYN